MTSKRVSKGASMTPEEKLLRAIGPPPNQPKKELLFIRQFLERTVKPGLKDVQDFKVAFKRRFGHYPHDCNEVHRG